MIIANDGPSASGKSTMARRLTQELNYDYIDTGAMYRAITWHMLEHDMMREEDICRELFGMELELLNGGIRLNDRALYQELRSDEVDRFVSFCSSLFCVRDFAGSLQQQLGKSGDVVMDGRDIGTVIFPHAELKFFLQASAEERARRRFLEKGGGSAQEVLQDILRRDRFDSHREVSPLVMADDAILIDSTARSIEEVLEEMKYHWEICHEKSNT